MTGTAGAEANSRSAAELSRRCRRGLARAGAALAGDEPAAVCATLRRWRDEGRRPWPWLAGTCYDALEPVGVTFPVDDTDAVVLGRLLIGRADDASEVRAALVPPVDDAPPPAPVPSQVVVPGGALRQRMLDGATDRFWDELTALCRALHPEVVAADRAAADRLVLGARRDLAEIAEEVARLAAQHAGPGPARRAPAPPSAEALSKAQPAAPAQTEQLATGPLPHALRAPSPPPVTAGVTAPVAALAPAPAEPARRSLPPPAPATSDQRDHTWVAVVFFLLAVSAAIVVLITVSG